MKKLALGVLLLLAIAAAYLVGSWSTQRAVNQNTVLGARKVLYYVDPMHPAYKSDKPGIAPDCGMELVPVYEGGDTGGAAAGAALPVGSVALNPEKRQLIGVQVSSVKRGASTLTIRTLGRVATDENRIHRIVSSTEGWIREIHGGTTGSLAKKDQILATFFIRDLVGPQQALFLGLSTLDRYKAANAPEDQIAGAGNQIRSAETSLMALGMSGTQLQELRQTRKLVREIEVRAPVTGFVSARNVFPNLRFDRNTELYRIADISQVWIVTDLFENEGRYFRPGVTARLSLPAFPGKIFQARVHDILPQADPTTRTLKVRLEADNPDFVLRPDMFVDVELPVTVSPALVVPADAVVNSGVKTIVYVATGEGVFTPRKVETGWRHGDQVEIVKGLMPGEKIVVSGTFLIDSESRMKAAAAGITGESSECPICGMEVDQTKVKAAGLTSAFRGQTFYFCANEDKVKFDQEPTRYAGTSGKEPATPVGKRLSAAQWEGATAKAKESAHVGHPHPPVSPVGESGSR